MENNQRERKSGGESDGLSLEMQQQPGDRWAGGEL